MIITIATWVIMLLVFSGIGTAIQCALNKINGKESFSLPTVIWLGIMGTAVFAQGWSLFAGVSKAALITIVLLAIVLLGLCRSKWPDYLKTLFKEVNHRYLYLFLFAGITVIALLFAVQEPGHYDTYLYHAQNIRWIEEFGVVKGLGNFHNRFAYNSSFMCLQALFSFKWCVGQSLHSLNGFLWIFMMLYAMGTLKIFKTGKIVASDFFKVLIIFYLADSSILGRLSSPHTDMLTLLLVVYIVTEWIALLEKEVPGYYEYAVLCLLGVFAASAKLSAVLVLVLVLKPACVLVREKKWKIVGLFIGSGILIILPFLIRNILISGYLVYPYSSIDLFDVEWKMPAYQVDFDNHEIITWGRNLKDVSRYEEPITAWLPIWLENEELTEKVFMILNIVLMPVSVIILVYNFIKKRYDKSLLLLCGCVLFAGWLFTAPLPRYGKIYMFIVPIFYLVNILKKVSNHTKTNAWCKVIVAFALVLLCIVPLQEVKDVSKNEYVLMPADYAEYYETEPIEWEGLEIYIPVNGDQGNYKDFPSIPYPSRLDLIELCGSNIQDGFRMKEEYRDKNVTTYGTIAE